MLPRMFRTGFASSVPWARWWLCMGVCLGLLAAAGMAGAQSEAASPQMAVRAEIHRPLQEAQTALRSRSFKEALLRVAEAEAVPGRTPSEAYAIALIKGVAAQGAGDSASAVDSFEVVLASPLLPRATRPQMLENAARLAISRQDMTRARRWLQAYFDEGGSNRDTRSLYGSVLFVQGDHAGSSRELRRVEIEDEAAGRATPLLTLRQLYTSLKALGDEAGMARVLAKLEAGGK